MGVRGPGPHACATAGGPAVLRACNADDVVNMSRRRSAWAVAGAGSVNAGFAAVRHVEECDREDGGHGAGVDGVLLVFGSFDEGLPGGVGVDAAFGAAL